MALKEYQPNNTIDLSGPEGNVFNLIGIAQKIAKQLDKDSKAIVAEMTSGDYMNAVFVFDREFGQFINLILPKGMTAQEVKSSYLKTNMNKDAMTEVYSK